MRAASLRRTSVVLRGALGLSQIAGLSLLLGCQKAQLRAPTDAGEHAPGSSAAVDGHAAPPLVDAARSVAGDSAPEPEFDRAAARAYRASLAEGRSATQSKRYADADAAFTRALEARPDDARALSERGYARLLGGLLDKADSDLRRALARGLQPRLAAQVFFNLGLLREKQHDEGARSSFAIANALAPSSAAQAKLDSGSACTADVRHGGDPLESFASFDALKDRIGPRADLGSAQASVCVRDTASEGLPETRDVCSGAPPWELVNNAMQFTASQYFVLPKKDGGLWLHEAGRMGEWPAHCTNDPGASAVLVGRILRITTSFSGSGGGIDAESAEDFHCIDVLGYTEDRFFDTRTGRRIATVTVPSGVPGPTISLQGDMVRLSGAGCDETMGADAK